MPKQNALPQKMDLSSRKRLLWITTEKMQPFLHFIQTDPIHWPSAVYRRLELSRLGLAESAPTKHSRFTKKSLAILIEAGSASQHGQQSIRLGGEETPRTWSGQCDDLLLSAQRSGDGGRCSLDFETLAGQGMIAIPRRRDTADNNSARTGPTVSTHRCTTSGVQAKKTLPNGQAG